MSKISNIIKKIKSKHVYNKKNLKAEKNQHKRRLSIHLCTSNIDWLNLQKR